MSLKPPNRNWDKTHNRKNSTRDTNSHFTGKGNINAPQNIKGCSSVVRKMQIKISMRYYLMHGHLAEVEKPTKPSLAENAEQGAFNTAAGSWKGHTHLRKP